MEFINRKIKPPARSYFLFGPRGTGKSTWVKQVYPQAMVIDLLKPSEQRHFQAYPERLKERIHGEQCDICVVDEIQKVPELLEVVHGMIEDVEHEITFILTGSSARKLRRGEVNLTGGRVVRRTLHPFMASELGDQFDLQTALEFGMVPLVRAADDPEEVLSGYIDLYLREEVKAEGYVRNLGDFTRFLEAVSFSHGQILNVSNVARECEVQRKTVEGFIEVLEDLLLCFKLPTFRKRAKRKMTKHPKFYLFDTGVYRSLRPSGPIDRPEEIQGAGLEGLVAQHLRAWIAYQNRDAQLYFWRTQGGAEVDFVVYGDYSFVAIEVKRSDKIHRSDLRHLKTFLDDYPESTGMMLYGGDKKRLIEDIYCLPCETFLRQLSPSSSIEPDE